MLFSLYCWLPVHFHIYFCMHIYHNDILFLLYIYKYIIIIIFIYNHLYLYIYHILYIQTYCVRREYVHTYVPYVYTYIHICKILALFYVIWHIFGTHLAHFPQRNLATLPELSLLSWYCDRQFWLCPYILNSVLWYIYIYINI